MYVLFYGLVEIANGLLDRVWNFEWNWWWSFLEQRKKSWVWKIFLRNLVVIFFFRFFLDANSDDMEGKEFHVQE